MNKTSVLLDPDVAQKRKCSASGLLIGKREEVLEKVVTRTLSVFRVLFFCFRFGVYFQNKFSLEFLS